MNQIKNWQVPKGFIVEHIATNLALPVNIAFVKNFDNNPGRPFLYIAELYGSIKVLTNDGKVLPYADGLLNFKPSFGFPGTGESGLTGICVEPDSGDIFYSTIYKEGRDTLAKVVRCKSDNGLKMTSSEVIIDKIPSVQAAHQIQALTIGPDKKLYINIGDGMKDKKVAQKDDDLRGKILRINLDGSTPEDNPIPGNPMYAKGLRNPFGAAWRKSDHSLYISDNGPQRNDRLAKIVAGGNYGWPKDMTQNSFHVWYHTEAPTAIDFMQNNQFPEEYKDNLFVALFGKAYSVGKGNKGKKIVRFKLDNNGNKIKEPDDFCKYIGSGAASPAGLAFGPDGLYFTDLHGDSTEKKMPIGNIYRIRYKG